MSQTVEIYFFGLICHIGPDDALGRRNAALIKTTNHIPRAVLGIPSSRPQEIDLSVGDILSLSLGEGDAVANTDFETYVPSLLDKTAKPGGLQSLKSGVRRSTNFDVAVAYFRHTRSSLGVASLFPQRADYEMNFKPSTEQCVAQVTLATAGTSSNDTIYLLRDNNGNQDKFAIQDGWVLIINSIHRQQLVGSAQHFEQHRNLTDASAIASVVQETVDCGIASSINNGTHRGDVLNYIYSHSLRQPIEGGEGRSELLPLDATQVECSNSRWP